MSARGWFDSPRGTSRIHPKSEEDMGARNEFKDPSGDEPSFPSSLSFSLSLYIEIETRQEYEPPVSPDIRFRVIGNTRRRR